MEEALDVIDTLSKANAVLQTHREKMRRRSSSVSPFPPTDPPPQPLPPSLLSGWTERQEDEEIEEVLLAAPQKSVAKLLSGGRRSRVAPIQSVWEDKENLVDTPTELFVIDNKDSSPLCSRTTKETIPPESQEVPLFSLQTTPTTSHDSPSQDTLSSSLL
uniref:Uncharacterized protein n=1 Tax=Amphimedon queenslandica TaxID=400682 RepID=A0A1X7T2L4_AMPQE